MYTPEDLTVSTLLISIPSSLMVILPCVALILCRDPMVINSVFAIFKLSLFVISQLLRRSNSELMTLWSSSRESAYIRIVCKHSRSGVVEAVWQGINIDKEQQWTQITPLWDSARY
jgi:hypothetical protein